MITVKDFVQVFVRKISVVKITLTICLAIFLCCPAAFATTPQELYDQAWKLTNQKYIDKTMNHQDWQAWRHKFDSQLKTKEDAYIAINTMLKSLNDPYTRFLSPEEYKEETVAITNNLAGIGIQINKENDKLLVSKLIEDTPAAKAGLHEYDHIAEINGNKTTVMSIDDAANSIRGREGTFVSLVINRKGESIKYNIQRENIKIKTISTNAPETLDSRIGYIKINSFLLDSTSTDFYKAFSKLSSKAGYIIDVRSNLGGLVFNALYIANLFLDGDSMLTIVDRNGYHNTINATRKYIKNKPIVVLVNNESASASEIFSAAMRDNAKAVLVGEKTYGKGIIQEINRLSDGSYINITIEQYLTPKGLSIHKQGITPDYIVPMTKEDIASGNDTQLRKAQELLLNKINL